MDVAKWMWWWKKVVEAKCIGSKVVGLFCRDEGVWLGMCRV